MQKAAVSGALDPVRNPPHLTGRWLMLGMPSGSSLHCTADDINPSGSTSLQPLDISIDISLSALTLKGVTFHLHTMLIKIHPYVLKEERMGAR